MAAKVESVSMEEVAKEVTRIAPLSVFETLNAVDVAEKIEKKDNLSYLSWAWAWTELQKRYPDASYTIERFGEEKKPYLYDEQAGYMVFTTVTIEGQTREMWLPVMDGANKAMKSEPYQYTVLRWDNTQRKKVPVSKTVQPATMFDINKAIMRCLVKNIGMFGLGLYIYAGEDLPEVEKEETSTEPQASKKESTPPKTEVTGAMLMEFKECQQKLTELGADIHSEKFMQWMADETGYGDQNADLQDVVKMQKLISTYRKMINTKEKHLKEQANANEG